MATPKVNSPSLAYALDSFGGKVENFTATLDAISEDIRSIEKWLLESGVRVEVETVYRNSEYVDDPAAAGSGIDIAGPFHGRRDISALAWAPSDEGKPWRLLHRQTVHEGTWEEGDWWWNETPLSVDSRPLIETPAATRLGLGDALAKLVEEIGSKVPAYREEILIEGDLRITDQSIPESGLGPWRVYFQTGREPESITGQRKYHEWADVADVVHRLVEAEIPPEHLAGHSLMFKRLKVSVRALRELKLM
jgi:hypothetical protein